MTGVYGAEADLSFRRFDARLQVANSSPMHPQSLASPSQHPHWTGGAGYTLPNGLRIGVSVHHGPYIPVESRWLSPGDDFRQFPATGVGTEVQWARGRVSVQGEWQRFEYPYPRVSSLIGSFGFAETKIIVTPRLFVAGRAGFRSFNYLVAAEQNYEAVIGYRPSRRQLIKLGYLKSRDESLGSARGDVLGLQYIYSFQGLPVRLP